MDANREHVTPEEMLQAAEVIVPALGMDVMFEHFGANPEVMAAFAASFVLVIQEIPDSTCECGVCDSLRTMAESVFPSGPHE